MTQPVDFIADAIKDLSGIASYTAEAWGHEQALRYAELLNEKFKKLQKGRYFQRSLSRNIRICTFADVSITISFSCTHKKAISLSFWRYCMNA